MGDFSRDTNDPRKHYSGVLMQQGRVQLDADWNEQLAIQLYRTELEARDVIGACGVPKTVGGFEIGLTPDALDLTISPGRIYVEGLLCESDATRVPLTFVQNAANRATVESLWVDGSALAQGQWLELSAANKTSTKLIRITGVDVQLHALTFDTSLSDYQNAGQAYLRRVATLLTQPDFPSASIGGLVEGGLSSPPSGNTASPPSSPPTSPPQALLTDGLYLVFIHAWKREITALDDTRIREVALGGPDTATRLRNVWQVKLLRVAPQSPPGGLKCKSSFPEWSSLVAPPTGRMNARTKPPDDEKDPCLLPPTAGFTRLENQLYRVEVQSGGTRQTATFKWSRDNAVVRTSVMNVNGAVLTVADVGRDDVLGFAGGQWVEIADEESVLKGAPRQLAQIDTIDPTTREITLKTTPTGLAGKKNLQLVRWDQTAGANADGVAMTSGWVDLEGGVQVQFSEGTYHAGDYWLIPARTATGEIEWPPFALPNTDPVAQPPVGLRHHFCRLALVEVAGGIINLKDCRKLFPSLTDICAEDICVDNTACDLPDVENLQDMIDRLCAARDLRWHNKHLHGWGIVCGLQVECGPDAPGQPRRHVTVRPGYALDCDGRDIVVNQPDRLDLVEMAGQLQSPPAILQNGEVCIRLELDEEGRRRYRIEEYTPPNNQLKELLAGTLLMDFYNDCIKPLVDFVREEFTPDADSEQALVGPARKRGITFGNLFVQYVEPVNGSRVFLSGNRGETTAESEHTILLNSYNRLLELLKSHTFCAMFEDARPFPEYPFTNTGITTIFGRGSQTRLRLHPNSRRAYTFGASNQINVYDLTTNELVQLLEFPGGPNSIVRDVAFSSDGKQMFAIASLGQDDSLFAIADITGSGLTHRFREPSVACDANFVTLATTAAVPDRVFAIGKGTGLYSLDPKNVPKSPQPLHSFNAVGQLVITDQPLFAWAAGANNSTLGEGVYDHVRRMNITGTPANPTQFSTQAGGQAARGRDDIAVVTVAGTSGAGPSQRLFMVIDAPPGTTTKHIVSFNAVSNTAGSSTTNLGENTRIRLAHNPATGHLMLTYEDSYRVGLLEPASNRLINYTHPAQLKPLSIAVAADQRHVYVLNFASNTLSKVPVTRFAPNNQLDLTALVNYRANVLEAYTDLWGGLFQYLKDCFCDHLLVNCPDCDDDDKIYLACVRFRNGQVFKVCNFSGRKYVKSFPTVEYWLSVFPILPLVGKLVEKICCAVFPNLFSRYHAERSTVNENGVKVAESRVSGEQIETGVMFAKQTNFRATIADQMLKLTAGRQVVQESVASAIKERNAAAPPAQDKPSISTNEVTGLKVEEARTKLEAAGVTVEGVEKYEPRSTVRNLARLAINPTRLRPGARITLVEQDGVVRIAEESPAPVRALREELAETKNAVAESREAIARTDALQKEVTELRQQLAEREHVIAELRETTKQFKEHAETLRLLREQVDSIRSVVRIPAPPAQPAKPAPSEHPALTEPPVKPAAGGTVKPAETPDVKPEKPEGGVKPTTRPVIKPRRGGGGGQEPTE